MNLGGMSLDNGVHWIDGLNPLNEWAFPKGCGI